MFGRLFKREKWESIYFTQNVDEYYRVKVKLTNNNIASKTNQIGGGFSGRDNQFHSGGNTSYEILIRESDIYQANAIIHDLK